MKKLFFIASMFCGLFLSAQTDSTDIKLEHYKEMFIKGLINAKEYDKLKATLLNLHRPTTKERKIARENAELHLSEQQKQVLTQQIRYDKIKGIVLTSTGAGFVVIGGGLLAVGLTNKEYSIADDNMSAAGYVFIGSGIILAIAGGAEFAVALRCRNKLKKASALVSFRPDTANTATIGYHPSPTMGLRVTF